jgi:two-component system, OmpR family, sensor histidine kinase KdpD
MNEDRQTIQEHGELEQRLLVAVAPGRLSEQLVSWTHRLARSLNCPWGAVYVETSSTLPKEDQAQMSRTLALARALGAEVITTTDPDFVRGLLRTASQRNATQIIVGKSIGASTLFRNDKWLKRLLKESGEIDIHIVRLKEEAPVKVSPVQAQPYGSTLQEYLIAATIILAVACLMTCFKSMIGYQAVAWIFLAVVVLMASFVGRGATLLGAILSALLWDYLFEEPRYSFYIASVGDRILFVMYFVISIVLGQFTAQIRQQERAERERQERAEALQRLTREVTEAAEFDDMLSRAVRQTMAVFKAQVALFLSSSPGPLKPHLTGTFQVPKEEDHVLAWAFEKGQPAGRFTLNFPLASALYLPLSAYGEKFGVIGLRLSQPFQPTIHQRNLLNAFSEQIALMIHRYQMHEFSEMSKVLAESERLSKTLLNSISHEIRTPLAVIQSAATHMIEFEKPDSSQSQRAMITEIQEATERLNRLVGKVLDITRLESGHVKPKFEACEVSDLIQMAEGETRKELAQHKLTIEIAPDLPPVPMDFGLMLVSLANLLSNAAFHTPAGTEVQLKAKAKDGALLLIVADSGPGIPPESISHVFEKFYRAPTARTGGTGLGLSIVKGFVEAHGGQVTAENHTTGGTAFTIHLPLKQKVLS